MSSFEKDVFVVALVATYQRLELLSRCLQSIFTQKRVPNALVISVDENESCGVSDVQDLIGQLSQPGNCDVHVISNTRTKFRAAGTWNSGLEFTVRKYLIDRKNSSTNIRLTSSNVFVAILDDDDTWEGNHIDACVKNVRDDTHVVVAGIIRHESSKPPKKQSIPSLDELHEKSFLCGNPHIQGSNMFIRLDTFLRAGMFDEFVESCTDRDMMTRILELGDVNVRTVQGCWSVNHYAEAERERLSTRGSGRKTRGSVTFYSKYSHRMSREEKQKFLKRSKGIFDVDVEKLISEAKSKLGKEKQRSQGEQAVGETCTKSKPLVMVCGVVSDSGSKRTGKLLETLAMFAKNSCLKQVFVLVVENDVDSNEEEPKSTVLSELVREYQRKEKLKIVWLPRSEQIRNARAEVFPDFVRRELLFGGKRLSISVTRTIIQHYLFCFHRNLVNNYIPKEEICCWVLDDDKYLSDEGKICEFLNEIVKFRDEKYDIVIGTDRDIPPLPALSCLRTQLVDMRYGLDVPNEPHSNLNFLTCENEGFSKDCCHDLSDSNFLHLEYPVFSAAKSNAESLRSCLKGQQPFRKLENEVASQQGSYFRGGNTIIFTPKFLLTPNFAMKFNAKFTRRSDFVWAILNREKGAKIIRSSKVALNHQRNDARDLSLKSFSDLKNDIMGYALYNSLNEYLKIRVERKNSQIEETVIRKFREFLNHRLARVVISFSRIHGLLQIIGDKNTKLRNQTNEVMQFFTDSSIIEFIQSFQRFDVSSVFAFFEKVKHYLRGDEVVSTPTLDVFTAPRIENARLVISSMTKVPSAKLEFVGFGKEGVIFRHDDLSYKLMDVYLLRNHRNVDDNLKLLKSLIGKWSHSTECRLNKIISVTEKANNVIICTPFLKGEQYDGGYGFEIVTLLQDFRKHGVACRNIKPENLVVVDGGHLKFIDYGIDIVSWTVGNDREMKKRALLSCMWSHRSDLATIMRERFPVEISLHWDRFCEVVDGDRLFWWGDEDLRIIVEKIEKMGGKRPLKILDFGCGNGHLIDMFETSSVIKGNYTYFGYDPKPSRRWPKYQNLKNVQFSTDVPTGRFDVVVLCKVLCVLTLGAGNYENVMSSLCSFVERDGNIFVSVCNPFFTNTKDTVMQKRFPEDHHHRNDESFQWKKMIQSSGNTRCDVHRPLHVLIRDFRKNGLDVTDVLCIPSIDVENFEENSDLLFMNVVPVQNNSDDEDVSLVIRSCAMEHDVVRKNVIHLVSQMEGPFAFKEIIIVVDCKQENFLRQYNGTEEVEKYKFEIEALAREKWVDKIIFHEAKDAKKINKKWFGVDDLENNHARNGAPICSTLRGIESVETKYFLLIDSDLLVHRDDRSFDYFSEISKLFERDENAVTVSLNISQVSSRKQFSYLSPDEKPWRVECRGAFFHKDRLMSILPMDLTKTNQELEVGWHRYLDQMIIASATRWRSYRGGSNSLCFVHPENSKKVDSSQLGIIIDRVESNPIPLFQRGKVNLLGGIRQWVAAERDEEFVFVVVGYKVPVHKIKRCISSMQDQTLKNWGAVIVNDGGEYHSMSYLKIICANDTRISVFNPRSRSGSLFNTKFAIEVVCSNPESVVVTLDLDDCMMNKTALVTLKKYYDRGHDVVVAGMVNTRKKSREQFRYEVDFESPRTKRGGNVWKHLRTFKKKLFDRISERDFRNSEGELFDVACDWSFMLPICEMSVNPIQIDDVLYYYQPGVNYQREVRESIISEIVSKPSYSKMKYNIGVIGDSFLKPDSKNLKIAFDLGKAISESIPNCVVMTGGRGGVMEEVSRGVHSVHSNKISVVALEPSCNPNNANSFSDIVVPTGLDLGRNSVVAGCHAIVCIGGGSGTLSEFAMASSKYRMLICVNIEGSCSAFFGKFVDRRRKYKKAVIVANTVEEVVENLKNGIHLYRHFHKTIPQ